ncbi:MAG: GNAT family N-acetyltransferase [Candidatus Promineifilaceae bacterium]
MVITFADSRTRNGARPIDPSQDFPQLVRLIRQVFADELDGNSQQIFDNVASSGYANIFWRMDPFLQRLIPGFVWQEDGKIVGNVTLIKTKSPYRYIVANVAILPEYRRRGIARALMERVRDEAIMRGASEIRLQVAQDNVAAKDLYRSLGYRALGTLTNWRRLPARSYSAPELYVGRGVEIDELPRSRWREAYELDVMALGSDLHWPDPLPYDAYRRGFVRRISDAATGRHIENWVISGSSGRLVGLLTISGEWGRSHQLSIRIHPENRGQFEGPLLQKAIRRLQLLPLRRAYLSHDAGDEVMSSLMPSARFQPERTLTQMRLLL